MTSLLLKYLSIGRIGTTPVVVSPMGNGAPSLGDLGNLGNLSDDDLDNMAIDFGCDFM